MKPPSTTGSGQEPRNLASQRRTVSRGGDRCPGDRLSGRMNGRKVSTGRIKTTTTLERKVRLMKIGAQVKAALTTWDKIRAVVETMDVGRWHSVYHGDHLIPMPDQASESAPMHESFTLISAVASITKHLRLGHMVLNNLLRNPALVTKMAATVDQIAHGRFTLGIGAGWLQGEHEAYGWYFPSIRERSDRLEEACSLIRALLTSEPPVDFHGRYYRLDNAYYAPGPAQEPHIPMMVGGTGEKRTLRTAAKYADVFNWLPTEEDGGLCMDVYRRKVDVLHRHCEEVGRDPGEIRHTVMAVTKLSSDKAEVDEFIDQTGPGTIAGTANYIIDRVGELSDAGIDEIMFAGIPHHPEEYQRYEEQVIVAFD